MVIGLLVFIIPLYARPAKDFNRAQARQKAQTNLEAAQKDLRQLLTADQQAVLLSLGYLD